MRNTAHMNGWKTLVHGLFLFFMTHVASGQLVNIESKRMQTDSTRFALKSDVLFDYTNNNGDYIVQVASNLTTQVKSKDLKKIYFFIGNYKLIRSQNQDFQNSWFFHVRYNQKLTDVFRMEAFVQNQRNTLLTITSRNLVGAGIRLKFLSNEYTKAYFGNSYMYEIEEVAQTDQRFFNHRNSSYVSLNQSFKNTKLDITATVYFQPLYTDIGNHRILGQVKAELPISKVISLSALYNYFYSSFSPIRESDRSSNLSFGLTFTM
ncbi:DUF481 domain-containing protein [Maribacter litopenaei]|uniref:DUF481 domain-containing protein n=1 Tax=Maribacter litopenaei TaxID=2976127 RepID=A0ABY5YDJ9_9FLAO|nr:DUF481 domain-containing protein [Maribacter litopenaei]UWX56490.1 DUF481 domain-containing protein [Maribacter litopenaei]